MSAKSGLLCSVCKKKVPPRAKNRFYPFCQDRCRQIDLGKWLGGEYIISRNLFPAHLMAPPVDDD